MSTHVFTPSMLTDPPDYRRRGMPTIAYHYTTAGHAAAILEAGVIRAADVGIGATEKPVCWFSSNRTWEPTACKLAVTEHGLRRLTFPEMVKVGIARFTVDVEAAELLPWISLVEAANIDPQMVLGMVRAGRKQGAHPKHWWGIVGPFKVENCLSFETFNPATGSWEVQA